MESPPGSNWCWFGTTVQCVLVASGGHGAQHPQCLDDGGVWGTLWQEVLANVARGVYNPQAIAKRLAEDGGMCVTVCRCSGHCKWIAAGGGDGHDSKSTTCDELRESVQSV